MKTTKYGVDQYGKAIEAAGEGDEEATMRIMGGTIEATTKATARRRQRFSYEVMEAVETLEKALDAVVNIATNDADNVEQAELAVEDAETEIRRAARRILSLVS